MKGPSRVAVVAVVLLAIASASVGAQKEVSLTVEEEDKIREAHDPAQRIEVYLALAQARLDRFDGFRNKTADPKYDNGTYLDQLLGQYIMLNDELKNWIDDQYRRNGDMRRGLRAVLERGPQQLEQLRRIQQSPDTFAKDYGDSLHAAIDQLTDTLDGATRALADQEKKFAALKREEKAAARLSKERAKEEQKRTKEEKKLRKRQHRTGVPAEPDEP